MAETLKQRLRRGVNRLLAPLGVQLVRSSRAFEMDGVIERAARRVAVGTWIDVGASDGSWSLRARRFFPRARFLLFEPLEERQPALTALHRAHGFEIVAAAAGAAPGSIGFAIDPALDGSGVAAPGAARTRTVTVQTIDALIAARGLPPPYAIKLDTHGHELPVLTGAAQTLRATELLIIESYNFTLAPGAVRFHELCAWLAERGFRCCDLADPMRRPSDGALWQMDLVFIRSDHPIFAKHTYD